MASQKPGKLSRPPTIPVRPNPDRKPGGRKSPVPHTRRVPGEGRPRGPGSKPPSKPQRREDTYSFQPSEAALNDMSGAEQRMFAKNMETILSDSFALRETPTIPPESYGSSQTVMSHISSKISSEEEHRKQVASKSIETMYGTPDNLTKAAKKHPEEIEFLSASLWKDGHLDWSKKIASYLPDERRKHFATNVKHRLNNPPSKFKDEGCKALNSLGFFSESKQSKAAGYEMMMGASKTAA